MQLHELQPNITKKTKKRIGRGGKRGKTSGRGHKGQKARAGNSGVPQMREIIKKLPKLRGHGKNRARTVNADKVLPEVVNLAALGTTFKDGAEVTPKTIVAAGILRNRRGKAPKVKVLGNGDIAHKISVSGCQVSKSAQEKIEKAGGSVVTQ